MIFVINRVSSRWRFVVVNRRLRWLGVFKKTLIVLRFLVHGSSFLLYWYWLRLPDGEWLYRLLFDFLFFAWRSHELIFESIEVKIKVWSWLVEVDRDIVFRRKRSFKMKLGIVNHFKVLMIPKELIHWDLLNHRRVFRNSSCRSLSLQFLWRRLRYLLFWLGGRGITHNTVEPHFFVFRRSYIFLGLLGGIIVAWMRLSNWSRVEVLH